MRRKASPAVAASPTTTMSAVLLSRSTNPRRTISWSSSRKTRIVWLSWPVARSIAAPFLPTRRNGRRAPLCASSLELGGSEARWPAQGSPIPIPLSRTLTDSELPSAATVTSTAVAWACLATLVMASRTTASTSPIRVPLTRVSTGPSKRTVGSKASAGVICSATVKTVDRTPGVVGHVLQLEDRRPDLPDGLVEVGHDSAEPLDVLRPVRARGEALQAQSGREEPLDDVVVQVEGDPVPVLQHR